MEYKKFQIVDWSKSVFNKIIILKTRIIDSYAELKRSIKCGKDYVIAIGYNPSNKTIFNDDTTNLYLRDKIKKAYNDEIKGYILVNLVPKIQTKSQGIGQEFIEDKYINEIITLIKEFSTSQIVLFFGQNGVKLLNCGNDSLKNLKELLNKNFKRIKYTSRQEEFIHPGRSVDNYVLIDWKLGLLG